MLTAIRQETIEDVVLRYSKRGMNILKNHMKEDYCREAAGQILELEKGTILLTTGFYVAGHAETDGPLGTLVMADALQKLGYHTVIVTDEFCRGFFENEGLEVYYAGVNDEAQEYDRMLETYRPVGLISIERCGRNVEDDYANMRGISIKEYTASTDWLFIQARKAGIPTFGVGDGGNEIGMGNLKEVIHEELALVPCKVKVDTLVIATVSNWGAYAIVAYMQKMTGVTGLLNFEKIYGYLARIVRMGSVDGVTKKHTLSVDGFSLEIEKEILDGLNQLAS